ncbi:MAG TPA: TIGR04211 family SH3 domain-containing protein [Desulfobulbus sp.]|nr:TIGR04211 family SH3 domain-containing protein [Desulfobulbus sp.]
MKRSILPPAAGSRLFLATVLFFLLATGGAVAKTLFVKPSAEVPLRRGQGKDYKIVAVLQDGTPVELLKTDDPWARVRLESGREGWILKRYLSGEPPLQEQLAALRREKEALVQRCEKTQRQLQELTDANAQTEKELTACMIERDRTRADYQALRKDTADVVRTKKRLADALQQVKSLESRLSTVQAENRTLKKNSRLMWFLSGSGVLLLGWLIGLISGRSRKRRSSLL